MYFNNINRIIIILICLILVGFSSPIECDNSILGDFNGDGVKESAWIKTQNEGQIGNGEGKEYIQAERRVLFSNRLFSEIDIKNASSIFNIGDINNNLADEILITGYHGTQPFDNTYTVYTFDTLSKYWKMVLNANNTVTSHGNPKKWVFIKNDTIYYWSTTQPDYSVEIKDTLMWIKK